MTPRLKVIIAGAGVTGLACALELARRGAQVAVCDPAALGDNASGVAAGMLAPAFEAAFDPLVRPHLDLLRSARDLWPELAERSGVALDRRGALAVAEEERLQALEAVLGALGLPAERLNAGQAAALAPGLAPRPAVFTPEDWRLDPGQALPALLEAALAAGVEVRKARLDLSEGADWRLFATGAEPSAAAAAPELARLSPIKGHILRAPDMAYSGAVVRGEGVYVTPGADGAVIGATMEAGLLAREVDPAQVARLRAAGARLFPQLEGARVEAGTGVRAATADGLPMAGVSRAAGVIVAAGVRRNGWLLAPLIAKIVAAQVFGEDARPFAARLAPARFEPGGGAY